MVMMVPTVEVLQDLIGLCHAYAATKTRVHGSAEPTLHGGLLDISMTKWECIYICG